MAPNGQIEVGLVSLPAGFSYSNPLDPSYALGFGVVTERGGDVDLYANGNISVDQSRVFTLAGGDIAAVSRTANIDAGKGAKTVQAIQPATVAYNSYGDITITPYGPANGSGIAVLRALPGVPLSNADLIAFEGVVNAGDAGIRVSGNINLAAIAVINAGNITVGGTATGIPVVQVPQIGALTTASNTAGANQAAAPPTTGSTNNNQASIIIVEFVGFGGGGNDPEPPTQPQNDKQKNDKQKSSDNNQNYNPNSSFKLLGNGALTEDQQKNLTDEERAKLRRLERNNAL